PAFSGYLKVQPACPACGDPYMEDERRNLDRKN
ncbi:MAG: DUF983 domain-containing protein, partial [Methanomassiliicoccales archaeon]